MDSDRVGQREHRKMNDETKNFIINEAKANIARVKDAPDYAAQAKQVNASLATVVALDRNDVMPRALEVQRAKHLNIEE